MRLEIDFKYFDNEGNVKLYNAKGQIKKGKVYRREEKDIEITIGESGDDFPCIVIKYNFMNNDFRILSLRKVNWGGSDEDEKVLCLNPSLEDKGSLDILVNLSLEIIYKIIEINKFEKEPTISINDKAFLNNYPLSWLKYKSKKEVLNKNTYAKYGFQLRNPYEVNKFKKYINEEIPIYLNLPLSEVIEDKNELIKELKKINNILTKKNKKLLEYNPSEKLGKFYP
jgi:hypothetical protein